MPSAVSNMSPMHHSTAAATPAQYSSCYSTVLQLLLQAPSTRRVFAFTQDTPAKRGGTVPEGCFAGCPRTIKLTQQTLAASDSYLPYVHRKLTISLISIQTFHPRKIQGQLPSASGRSYQQHLSISEPESSTSTSTSPSPSPSPSTTAPESRGQSQAQRRPRLVA